MKKSLLVICLSFAFYAISFAQDVPEVQKTLMTKVTATWCPFCGGWGWTFFEDLIVDNEEKAVFVGAHHSGDLESSPGESFSANFMAPYQPYFYAGNQDVGANSGNFDDKRQEVMDLIDANYLLSPVANVGFDAELLDNTLTVNTKTQFFQEATGDFYLGVYVLENGVINNQVSNSSMAVHPYVLRAGFTADPFGMALDNGTIALGTEFTESFSMDLNTDWVKDNITVAGVIWEKIDDTYQFVNVNTINEFPAPPPVSTQNIPSDVLNVQLYPTIAKESTQLSLNLKDQALNVTVQLFNLNGQAVRQVFQGTLTNGNQSLEIATSDLNAGVYFVNIMAEDGAVLTKKLIVQ